jgi:hypothetical protein
MVQMQKRSKKIVCGVLMRVFLPLMVLLICCFAAYAQSAPVPQAIEEAYLARDNGEGKAGDQVTEFATTDIPIYCVVLLESSQTSVVKMNFVAVSVSGVKPETKVVTASYKTKDGENRVNFTGKPDGKWTPGKYRVDIFLDGKMEKNLVFDIKSSASGFSGAASFQPPKRPVKRPKN